MLFISMDHLPAIVSPASKAVRLTTESWLGAPIQRTASVVGGGERVRKCARACVRACVMCLRYTIMIFYPG